MAPVPTEVQYEDGKREGEANLPDPSKIDSAESTADDPKPSGKKMRCVVIGLGMVGIAFIEKLLKYDIDGGRDEWEVTV
jgi:nitrite reductase (NAD(P)H)